MGERAGRWSAENVLYYARQLLKGLTVLHATGLAHGDINLANIVDDKTHARFCDYGSVREDTDRTAIGWDIYNFGAAMYELMSGRKSRSNLLDKMFSSQVKITKMHIVFEEDQDLEKWASPSGRILFKMIRQCLIKDIAKCASA